MELLCVLAAVAALFCGCAVLTLKCRVPASVAPLTALSAIVAVLTLAAMAGVLYPAAWLLYLLCLAGGVWVAASCKASTGAAQAPFYPGQLAFLGHGAGVHRLLFVRQPMATDFDELSLWATAVKITKVNERLYATAELGTPGPRPRTPACRCWRISSSFSAIMQIGKIYVGYDILYFSVFAAVVGAVPRRKWRGRADGRRAVVRAVLLHELQPHDLPDHHLHDQLRRRARGPGVRRRRGRVAGAAPKNSPLSGPCCRFWRCLPTSRPIRLYWRWWRRGWWLWTSGCLPTTAISRPVCSPHRVQPGLFCRTDGNLLSVECALCRLARQPQRQ